jgi:mannosyltransferase OCH1-like enzyme
MAYFLWDDEGMRQLISTFEPDLLDAFLALPAPVERADIFRIVVTKWIGGIVSSPVTLQSFQD